MKTPAQLSEDLLKIYENGYTDEVDFYIDKNLSAFRKCPKGSILRQIYDLSMDMYDTPEMDNLLKQLKNNN